MPAVLSVAELNVGKNEFALEDEELILYI